MAEYINKELIDEIHLVYPLGDSEKTKAYKRGVADALAAIKKQIPAEDVAPVRHGEWIEDDYGFNRCTECGFEHDEAEYITPFCPHCGAKMVERCNINE